LKDVCLRRRVQYNSRYAEFPGKKLYGKPIRLVAAITHYAAATLSVDTGIRHLAAACGGNLYCLSGAIPLTLIRCVRVRDIQVIVEEQKPVSMVTLKMLIDGAKKALGMS
jgi:hypothetical protein